MNDAARLIERYFALAVRPDRDAYLAQFAEEAVVEDEGRERRGIAAIRAWRGEVPPVTYAVRKIEPDDDGHVAHAEISGDFPGSPVVLRFRFEFAADGHITALSIRP